MIISFTGKSMPLSVETVHDCIVRTPISTSFINSARRVESIVFRCKFESYYVEFNSTSVCISYNASNDTIVMLQILKDEN